MNNKTLQYQYNLSDPEIAYVSHDSAENICHFYAEM
jgi:hypothetical protein